MALSQFIPSIRIGYLYTYWAPLAFVIAVTMLREAYDDFKRYRRDKELNSQLYKILTYDGIKMVPSSKLKVSDVIIIEKVFFLFKFKILFFTRFKIQKFIFQESTCASRYCLAQDVGEIGHVFHTHGSIRR